MWLMLRVDRRDVVTHEDQGCVEIIVVPLHFFSIVLRRLSLVHGEKIKPGIIVLDGLEVLP